MARRMPRAGDRASFQIHAIRRARVPSVEERTMRVLPGAIGVAAILAAGAAAAHHGWGSYDASKTVVLDGPVLESSYEFPHGEMVIELNGERWTATLAPPSRMRSRGLAREDIAVGKRVRAEG